MRHLAIGEPVNVQTDGEMADVLKKGEELDYEKASRLLLEEFRSGKLGKVTLEFPKGPEEA